MAKDALGGHMWTLEDIDENVPDPTTLVDVALETNQRVMLVEVYMPLIRDAISTQAVKKTLTIPAWLNEAAEKEGVNFSQLLQSTLKKVLQSAT